MHQPPIRSAPASVAPVPEARPQVPATPVQVPVGSVQVPGESVQGGLSHGICDGDCLPPLDVDSLTPPTVTGSLVGYADTHYEVRGVIATGSSYCRIAHKRVTSVVLVWARDREAVPDSQVGPVVMRKPQYASPLDPHAPDVIHEGEVWTLSVTQVRRFLSGAISSAPFVFAGSVWLSGFQSAASSSSVVVGGLPRPDLLPPGATQHGLRQTPPRAVCYRRDRGTPTVRQCP